MLNGFELTPACTRRKSRYKKTVAAARDLEDFFVDVFLKLITLSDKKYPQPTVLDLGATEGRIEVRFE